MASYVLDRGDYGRFSAQIANITTSGDPITTTTFFGADQTLYPGPQGRLFSSVLADQVQTLAGVRALFHPLHDNDVLIELGEGWYHDGLAPSPARNRRARTNTFHSPIISTRALMSGSNIIASIRAMPTSSCRTVYRRTCGASRGRGRDSGSSRPIKPWTTRSLESIAQVIARTRIICTAGAGARRRVRLATDRADHVVERVAGRLGRRVLPPQFDSDASLGWQRQAALYAVWHWPSDDVVLDSVWDRSYRPATDPVDFVSMNYPQVIGTYQHRWKGKMVAAIGYGRYSANGYWSTTPVLGIYGEAFVGGEWDFTHGQQLLVQLRRYGLTGLPSIPGGPAPTMRGTALVVDQRIQL